MISQIYPTDPQLNKATSFDTEAPLLALDLSIAYNIVRSKIDDKQDDSNFEIVSFPIPDGDVSRTPFYCVYISQLVRFAKACLNVSYFNNKNNNL